MVRGKCWVEVITIRHSKCSIFQLVLFKFNRSHQYVYPLLIICFCHVLLLVLPTRSETTQKSYRSYYRVFLFTIFHLIWYWVIIFHSGMKFLKVSAIYLQIWLLWSDLYRWFYTFFSMFESISITKNQKQGIRGTIFHTGCKHQTADQFKGQEDSWEWAWFSVGIWPVLKWLSWSSTVPSLS